PRPKDLVRFLAPHPNVQRGVSHAAPRGVSVAVDTGGGASVRQRPFALWVIAGGLVYVTLALLVFALSFLAAIPAGFLAILVAFVVLFLIAAVFTLREKCWAYILAPVTGIVLALLFSLNISTSASNPSVRGFWFTMSVLPALFVVVLFSVLALRSAMTELRHRCELPIV